MASVAMTGEAPESGFDTPAWRLATARLAIAWLAILTAFWSDAWDMVRIWWEASTYNHILLIPPILAWLVSQRADALKRLEPAPWIGGVVPLAAAATLWILGSAAELNLARHLALVLFLQGSAILILGKQVSWALLFPLFFAFFMVPVGEELVPALQMATAKMAMVMLGWAGIPAHIEGVFISTPTGYFEVAEACSGVKFLIAMVTFGVLAANVCFKRWKRRLAFVALSIVVPVLANGVRAWGTIYIAHHQGIDFAAGFDHVFYGWFFFAFVLTLVLGIGWPFFDRSVNEPMLEAGAVERIAAMPNGAGLGRRGIAAAVAVALLVPLGWSALGDPPPAEIASSIAAPDIPGWQIVDEEPRAEWQPRADGANAARLIRYRRDGMTVDLFVALYDGQGEGREVAGFGQGAIDPDGDWAWVEPGRAFPDARVERITAPGPVMREVLTSYKVGDTLTGSASRVKLAVLPSRLFHRPQAAAMILISAEEQGVTQPRAAIDAFLQDAPAIDKLADDLMQSR